MIARDRFKLISRKIVIISAGACGILLSLLSASPASEEQQATIRTRVELVNIVFTAMDANGKPVAGLSRESFQVFDNKQPQKIEYFSELGKSTEVPLTIALIIDTSGSVKNELEYEKTTAAQFFRDVLRPERDLALIMQFDSEVNLVQDFTQSHQALIDALDSLKAGNSTSLYDAIYLAADEKLKNETGRKVMVVIADGEDNSSKVTKEEAIEAAQRSDAIIYGIGVQTEQSSFKVLRKFAEETGGVFFSPHPRQVEIQAAFRAIGEAIQGQYSLAYSLDGNQDGSFHTVEIKCSVRGVRIRARKGYYAPKAGPADSGN
jgi:VWFA-related protein